jgi:D-3-phosphoglycerate dehydrogenase
MLDARHFEAMKDGVIVINCARGQIVNEAAMLAALQSGKVRGAAFDVFSEEPPRSELVKQLIAHPRMVVTPHLGANTFEAQKNVAVDVSNEIVRYLDGKPLESAVNIPKFDADLMQVMQPFLSLIQQMGEFIVQLAPANPSKVTFTYNGKLARYDCSPLTVCGLAALLNRSTEQEINMVNSQLIAEQMGISVETVCSTDAESFSSLVTISLTTPAGKRTVAGTIFEGIPKIVKMRDFSTDFQPEEHMLVISYADKPGLIGKIGTILGEAGINIGSMNLGRRAKAGEAMVVLSVDTPASTEVLDRLATSIEAAFIRSIHMENVLSNN